jgi:alpha-L-fucosidase
MNMPNLVSLLTTLLLTGASISTVAAEPDPTHDARMRWWREARFGLFIHWGLYAIPAGEWNGRTNYAEWIRHQAQIPLEQYNTFTNQFNPVKFDANAWARLAHRAGMKYLVITSKHHDGFCLWPSDLTEFDVASTPFNRDILKELSTACEQQDVRFCTYHSIMDWHHPDYLPRRKWEVDTRPVDGADFERFRAYLKGQLRELVTDYNPGVLWFDGEWEDTWTHEMGVDLYDHVRSLNPRILINNRVDKGRKGMQGLTKDGSFRGDFGTPEQEIPAEGLPGVDWESCMTMNRHWGWNRFDTEWKSTKDLVRKLIDIASKGGNFLLNVGPKADGTFPDEAVERLEGIGRWMDGNAAAIHGSFASPIGQAAWGRCTRRPLPADGTSRLYLHVFDWPTDGRLVVANLRGRPLTARLLTTERSLQVTKAEDAKVTISVPAEAPDPIASVIVLDVQAE